jgi:hypothetical protein
MEKPRSNILLLFGSDYYFLAKCLECFFDTLITPIYYVNMNNGKKVPGHFQNFWNEKCFYWCIFKVKVKIKVKVIQGNGKKGLLIIFLNEGQGHQKKCPF